MNARAQIERLVAAAAHYWAGEAEVVRTYWTAPLRRAATDLRWLERQCFKEFWGTGAQKYDRGGAFVGVMKYLLERQQEIDRGLPRSEVLDVLEGLKAEFSHYCAFADIYDAIRPAETPPITPEALSSWPAEDALAALRHGHQDKHGTVGLRACNFTEGGYCALFAEGKKLGGKGGIDDMIAKACTFVFEDEFEHMLRGIVDIGNEGFSDADWELMSALVADQLRHRIRMRNEQFSFPISEARIAAIFRGEIEPARFDYARAGLAAA
ncbi:MAG TPA: hypothetical protein VMU87_17935 [Stellaceae bacterium]|nr:hypothetical protein [Stellaceae bacterium]